MVLDDSRGQLRDPKLITLPDLNTKSADCGDRILVFRPSQNGYHQDPSWSFHNLDKDKEVLTIQGPVATHSSAQVLFMRPVEEDQTQMQIIICLHKIEEETDVWIREEVALRELVGFDDELVAF